MAANKAQDISPLTEAQAAAKAKDLATTPIRKMTQNERGIYADAVVEAILNVPAFRDAIALMRPYMDATAETAYTDRHARAGFGYWFFYQINKEQRAAVLLHECMHVLNNHFARAEELPFLNNNARIFNYAGDFEINTTLARIPHLNLSAGIFPDRDPFSFPPQRTMEYYAKVLDDLRKEQEKEAKDNCPACNPNKPDEDAESKEGKTENGSPTDGDSQEQGDGAGKPDAEADSDSGDSDSGDGADGEQPGDSGQGSGGSQPGHTCGKGEGSGEGEGQGSGQGQGQGSGSGSGGVPDLTGKGAQAGGCDPATDTRDAGADEAGIEKASDVEQAIAKKNTAARILEEKNSGGRGLGVGNDFWDVMLKNLAPPVVDWRKIFRRLIASSVDSITRGRADYSYRRPNRRTQGSPYVFPGMVNYLPKIMLGVDTSGSMGNEDYQKLLNEIEGLLKDVARGKDAVSVFSVDTKIGKTSEVSSVRNIRFNGGGGTQMAVAWQYIKTLPKAKRPDIFVLSTDGYIDWEDVEEEVRSSDFSAVICVTQKGGFQSAPASLKRLIPVLDISGDS